MKAILILAILVLCAGAGLASMDVNIEMDSYGEDITVTTKPNSGNGTTTYIIDGFDFDKSVQHLDERISSSQPDSSYLHLQIGKAVGFEYDSSKRQFIPVPEADLNYGQRVLRSIMFHLFVPREEEEKIIKKQESEISQLKLELLAVEELFSKEQVCQARMDIVKKFNLTSTTCDDTIYYNHLEGRKLVGLREVKVVAAQNNPTLNNKTGRKDSICLLNKTT